MSANRHKFKAIACCGFILSSGPKQVHGTGMAARIRQIEKLIKMQTVAVANYSICKRNLGSKHRPAAIVSSTAITRTAKNFVRLTGTKSDTSNDACS